MRLSESAIFKKLAIPAALAAGAAGAQMMVVASPALAAEDGAFTVWVGDRTTSGDLRDMSVTLINAVTGAVVGAPLTTEADGRVVFPGLPDGEYLVKVTDPTGRYQEGYSTSDTVTAADLNAYRAVRLYSTSIEFGRLGGTVFAPGKRYLEALVEVYPGTATAASVASGDVDPVESDWVNGDDDDADGTAEGDWSVNVPGDGATYKVVVRDYDSRTCDYVYDAYGYPDYVCTYANEVWVGGAGADDAKQFTVNNAQVTTADRVGFGGGSTSGDPKVTGTVTGAGGAAIDDIDVDLLVSCGDDWQVAASTETGDDGAYGFDTGRLFAEEVYNGHTYCYGDGYGELRPTDTFTLRFSDGASGGYSSGTTEYQSVFLGGLAADGSSTPPAGVETFQVPATGSITKNIVMTQNPMETSSGMKGSVADDAGSAFRGTVAFYDVNGNVAYSTYTRRNGTWSAPLSVLAPGSYKLFVSGNGSVVQGWYDGAKTFKRTTTYTVTPGSVREAGTSRLARYAAIEGTVTMQATSSQDERDGDVSIYDSVGRYYRTAAVNDDGSYSVKAVPGTYYVVAEGEVWSSFDLSDTTTSRQAMITQFWKGANSLRTATPVKVGSGTKATLNFNLGTKIAALVKPTIKGKATPGKKLVASSGQWNVADGLTFTYTWKSGKKVVGSNSASYRISKKDKKITVTVRATDANGDFVAGSSTSRIIKVTKKK